MILSLLAGSQRYPVGGITSVYEYANAMSRRGHEVHLVHFSWARPSVTSLAEVSWFDFDERVLHHFDVSGGGGGIALPAADFVSDPNLPRRYGLPFLFFQGTRPMSRQALDLMYGADCPRICVASWLVEEAIAEGVPAEQLVHIPDGVDHGRFRVLTPLERRPPRVAMLFHPAGFKGTPHGLAALEEAKRRFPELEAVLFGAKEPTQPIPSWATVLQDPPPDRLVGEVYNGSRIFLCPSLWGEGFGKTSVEAMACGCALVTTANGGSGDFAFHDETALVSPPEDVDAMADHIVALLRDDDRRRRLAGAGRAYVARFDWDESARQLEEFLERYRVDPDRYLGRAG